MNLYALSDIKDTNSVVSYVSYIAYDLSYNQSTMDVVEHKFNTFVSAEDTSVRKISNEFGFSLT